MKQHVESILEKYAHFVARNPVLVLLLVVVLTTAAITQLSNIETTSLDNSDGLPDNIEVIKAYEILADSFGNDASITVAIEIDPENAGSNEIRDIRDPRAIRYVNMLSEAIIHDQDVQDVSSISTLLRSQNNDILPSSERRIIEMSKDNPAFGTYISDDYEMTLITIELSDSYEAREIVDDLTGIIEQFPRPPGLEVNPAGNAATDPIIEDTVGPDMGRTSNFSLLAIILTLVILFRSVRYSLTPLGVIGIGVIWAMGFMGLVGRGLNPATSGVISMIMGIGIDFGIQIVTRFREEIEKNSDAEEAITITMKNVMMPMITTTIAALIGFRAMSMGQLTIMGEFGEIMSYGVTACFLAAITVVPSVLALTERFKGKKGIPGRSSKPVRKKEMKHSSDLRRRKLKRPSTLIKQLMEESK